MSAPAAAYAPVLTPETRARVLAAAPSTLRLLRDGATFPAAIRAAARAELARRADETCADFDPDLDAATWYARRSGGEPR